MAMFDAQKAMTLLNPWAFNLQKLGFELKCPSCLDLLNRPVLLPCNHIFCNSCVPKSSQLIGRCAACQQHFTDAEIRPASYMENIVVIYKSLNATFNSSILPRLSTANSGTPNSISNPVHQLKNRFSEMAAGGNNNNAEADGLHNGAVSEELDVKHHLGMFPENSPSSSVAKEAAGCNSDPSSGNMITENQGLIKSNREDLGTATGEVNYEDTFPTREAKRQKKLNYGSPEKLPQSLGLGQQMVSDSDQAAVSNCNEHKFKEDTSIVSALAPCDASYTNGSSCAFCQSSKITEGTGSLLHYANGKVVGKDENAFSTAIPVHSNCIEWTPQVYFSGDKIKNLESELARASKLKCTRCGLKGAALGCFAKSCRRTYHVPCALEIPGCRWNCDDFVMLCPAHKSIKFPGEKSKSKKQRSGEKRCLSTQSVSEQPDFWATSLDGPQEWVLCGSALSSEEKSLVGKFATICGATVLRTWNTDVTHVIAATDSNGACSRTLKVLMAILHGRWILTMDWIRDCVEANCPMNEEPYEVNLDNHGFCDGPKTGRLRASTNAPKLFDGLNFYFNGDFIPSFKSDLLELVRVGGGTIIESTKQIAMQNHSPQAIASTAFVVYNHDSQGSVPAEVSSLVLNRLAAAKDVAKDIDARVIPHTWILESIAACRVLA